jgi:hypothetical protein
VDPLFVKWASAAFAALLLLAARHKFASIPVFRAVLLDYRLLPQALLAPAAWTIPSVELLLAAAWIATWTGAVPVIIPAAATAALFAAYTYAIAVNLLRGRRYVTCGCGLTGGDGEPLSWSLVSRNLLLVALALAAALPAPARKVGAADYAILAATLLASALLYLAASQLLQNAAAFGSWRRGRD